MAKNGAANGINGTPAQILNEMGRKTTVRMDPHLAYEMELWLGVRKFQRRGPYTMQDLLVEGAKLYMKTNPMTRRQREAAELLMKTGEKQ